MIIWKKSDVIASYAYFHDAGFKYLKSFVLTHIIIQATVSERVNDNLCVHFCPGRGKEMVFFGKTGTETM